MANSVSVEQLELLLDSPPRNPLHGSMSDDLSELFDNPFHGAALTAFVEQSQLRQDWPCPLATRIQAYALFEAELASSPRNRK
jgi:hypothetical protein